MKFDESDIKIMKMCQLVLSMVHRMEIMEREHANTKRELQETKTMLSDRMDAMQAQLADLKSSVLSSNGRALSSRIDGQLTGNTTATTSGSSSSSVLPVVVAFNSDYQLDDYRKEMGDLFEGLPYRKSDVRHSLHFIREPGQMPRPVHKDAKTLLVYVTYAGDPGYTR